MLLTSSVPTLLKRAGVVCLLVAGAQFGFARCPGMDSDSHFQKLDETSMVRVFTLQLERLESTAKHCHEHAFFYVVTSDSETNDTLEGHAGIGRKWRAGAARFVQNPETHIIRNETATVHREVIVEILNRLEYNPLNPGYDTEDFSGDGSPQISSTTWTVPVQHGPMGAVKAQIMPGNKLNFDASTKILIALTDGTLQGLGKDFELSRQDVQLISSDSEFTLTNTGRFPIRFISIRY